MRISAKGEAEYSVAGRVVHRASKERREDDVRESNQSRRKVLLAMKQRGFTQPAKLPVGAGVLRGAVGAKRATLGGAADGRTSTRVD